QRGSRVQTSFVATGDTRRPRGGRRRPMSRAAAADVGTAFRARPAAAPSPGGQGMLPLVITVTQADGGTRRYAFADSPVSIGRNPFAELQLIEPFISRWEGTLRFDATEITFFNLGS